MSDNKVKVWDALFLQKPLNHVSINFALDCSLEERARVSRIFHELHTPLVNEQVPDYLHFKLKDLSEKKKSNLPDFFSITGGLTIISARFHDLLQRFDLGDTQFFPLTLYEYDQKTPRPGIWYLINITARKSAFVPEESDGFEEMPSGRWDPYLDTDKAAISRSGAAGGVDLWIDPAVKRRLYLSDRLVKAIKAGKIRVRAFGLRPCKMVD